MNNIHCKADAQGVKLPLNPVFTHGPLEQAEMHLVSIDLFHCLKYFTHLL